MRKLFYFVVCFSLLTLGSTAFAGDLRVGVSRITTGHSDSGERCLDDGWAVEVGYDKTIYHNDFQLRDFSFDLDMGPELIYSKYQTAERDCVGCERFNKKIDTSINLSGIIKPTINMGDFSVYCIAGIGGDYMEQDGLDASYTYGYGIDYQISYRWSLGIYQKKIFQGYAWKDREDTGHYTYVGGLVKMSF